MTEEDHKRVREWEERVMKQCITDLLSAGFKLSVDNGGGLGPWSRDLEETFSAMRHSDEDYLFCKQEGGGSRWVRFIYGNDGYDVINDYSSSLEDVLKNTNALVEKLNKEWEQL